MAHISSAQRRPRHGLGLLLGPSLLLVGAAILAAGYVAYVLWPRWPGAPIPANAPALPVEVAGVMFEVEPAAIRPPVQRRAGVQERLDLAYLWPSLSPPDQNEAPTAAGPADPNGRLFVTIANGKDLLAPIERFRAIYPRYLDAAVAGPAGLSLQPFRDGTPYQGEDLIYNASAPERFLLRCSRSGVGNSGTCFSERRIGNADITVRFPRDWLDDWQAVAQGIDRLIARLHPAGRP